MEEERIYIDQFAWTRILACFCVILLNSLYAGNGYFEASMTPGEVVWTKLMENSLMWAMPTFLMITGALLMDPARELPLKKLFGKYLRRVVLALVCFTLICQILGYKMEGEETILSGWLLDLLNGTSWAHMWYLYLVIGLYLMMPFYRMIAQKADETQMDYLILVLIVFTSVVPAIESLGIGIGFYIPTMLVYPVYTILGYRLFSRPIRPILAVCLLVFCTLAILALTWLRYGTDTLAAFDTDSGNQLDILTSYSSFLVIGQTAGLFSLLNRIKTPVAELGRAADESTFGIYLMHMIGIHMIMRWANLNPYWYGPFTFILMAAVLFMVCFGITWLIRKIPKVDLL